MTSPARTPAPGHQAADEPDVVAGLSAWDLACKAVRHCVDGGGHYDVYLNLDPGRRTLSPATEHEVTTTTWTLTAFDWDGPGDAWVILNFKATAIAPAPLPDDYSPRRRMARRAAAILLHLAVTLLRPSSHTSHRPRQTIPDEPPGGRGLRPGRPPPRLLGGLTADAPHGQASTADRRAGPVAVPRASTPLPATLRPRHDATTLPPRRAPIRRTVDRQRPRHRRPTRPCHR